MANVASFSSRRTRKGTIVDVLIRYLRNTIIAFAVFFALVNPTGLSILHWLFFSLVPADVQAEIGGYIGRLFTFTATAVEWIITGSVLLILGGLVYATLRMSSGVRALVLTAAFVLSIAGMIALGMTWYQTIAYAATVGAAMLMVYTIERYLKLIGSVFVLVIYGSVLWGISQAGLFDVTNGTHIGWAVLGFLTLLGGTAASTGFILLWWQSRLQVEDPDTGSSYGNGHDHNQPQDGHHTAH